MTFSLFFQSLINGLNLGATYALIALGYKIGRASCRERV